MSKEFKPKSIKREYIDFLKAVVKPTFGETVKKLKSNTAKYCDPAVSIYSEIIPAYWETVELDVEVEPTACSPITIKAVLTQPDLYADVPVYELNIFLCSFGDVYSEECNLKFKYGLDGQMLKGA